MGCGISSPGVDGAPSTAPVPVFDGSVQNSASDWLALEAIVPADEFQALRSARASITYTPLAFQTFDPLGRTAPSTNRFAGSQGVTRGNSSGAVAATTNNVSMRSGSSSVLMPETARASSVSLLPPAASDHVPNAPMTQDEE